MKNIQSRALSLAHEIKSAYSSFRLALLAAYKAIRSSTDNFKIRLAMIKAHNSLIKLNLLEKAKGFMRASQALYNLEYLD